MEHRKLDVLIPLAGTSIFFNESNYPFPKPLIEVNGKPMIQLVLEQLNSMEIVEKFIFVLNSEDCRKFHLDSVLRLLTDNRCEIIKLDKTTKGAACSVLMAIDEINPEKELLICNGDQIIEEDYNDIIGHFRTDDYDAGVVTFNSVHPRWSYVRLDKKGEIIETAEKRPLSNSAIAGFYYFKKGQMFVDAAMKMIEKGASVNDAYYIAPTLNELVLQNCKLGVYAIENEKYHSFYSPQNIKAYESI
ncbi:glycosyltransferase family 2 protein [Lentiprolixibacter aurantiacus]|uniref:Glycosyltransferase family 2 protein n=1 Tax=Lentiprolixibacter aurantiacus TaxID=2993939 RepID=A0AAE3MJ53_9FLAO|nr:glycosyltransferase family 2 protein [Lentiprolixibacter aurantiacus]MCX2718541.1 glycosyltransferase family 2 protein [Lentiprolixibacter aurantiacus]